MSGRIDEMDVVVRLTAEGVDEALGSVRDAMADVLGETQKVKRSGNPHREAKDGANEAAAAEAMLAAACAKAFAVIKGAVDGGTEAYNRHTAAVKGLQSVAAAQGVAQQDVQRALAGVTDSFLSASGAATAYKNLLSRGYNLDQATQTITRLKDAAAFGRAANLSLEEAVVSATEGIRQENSVLVDNAGVTKNVAKMWEEYARANGLSAAAMTQAQKVEAEYQGILRETAAQAGDLAKAQDTLMGAQAENSAQADKLATAYGGALEPAMKAVTEAGTGVLEALTAATRQMPGLASGATAAVAAMTALSTAMQGVKAVKGLIGAAGMTAATAGPLAAVAAAVGLLTAAYTAYAKKREEASAQEEAAAQAVREQEAARRAELRRLSDVNGELTALTAQYAQSQAATGALAGAYDQGNDAIGDRIALLQAEQTELLKTQEAQIQAALAEKQAALARSIETAKGVAALGAPDLSLLGEDPMGSAWYTQVIDEFCDTVTARFPEVTAQANAFRQEMMMATTFSETQAAYEGFTQAISDGIAQNADDVAALTETLAQIGEAIANPEGFSFEKTFGGVEFAQEAQEGAQGAADAFDGLGEAAQDAAKDFKTLKTQADRTARGLSNTTAMKRQVRAYREMAQEAKRAGGGWDALGADVKAFSKRLGVADGDIDVLIASLGAMEGRLDESMAGGIADAQNLIGSLQGVKDTILAIPSAQLDGDPGPLLAAIDAAMAGLMQLLALIDQTGMAPAGTGGRRGGGGGGGSKKSDAGGAAKDADRAQEEAYRREIERIEHKRHMNEMTAREEIEALGRVKREHAKTAEQIMDIDERIYDARKALREGEEEKITALGDALTDALQNRYEAQRKAEQQRIRDSIKAWETWSDETCAAIQKQLDALDEQEEAEEREEKRAEHLRKIGRLEQAIAYETDDYNRAQLQKQLEEAKRAYEQALGDWAREDERKALEDQMDAIRDQADKEIGKLEDESERIDSVYDELTKGASLAAEAQKLLMQSSQEELLALLGEFAPDYEATGRTLGEKLYEGFAAAFGNVEAFFASFDARFEAMADRAQQAALGNTQGIVQSGGDKASVSAPTVNQTVIFNEPVESPADVARRMQRISEELAGMM